MATQSIKVADIFASFGFRIDKQQVQSVTNAIHSGGQSVDNFTRKVNRQNGSIHRLIGTMRQWEGVLYAVGTFQLGQFLTNTTREAESMDNALRAAAGSAEAFDKNNKFLTKSVDELGLSLKETSHDYVNMLASGKDLIGTSGVQEIFGAVTEYSTVLGLNADKTHGTLLALTQIMSKGKVQSEELRGQLGERLPNAYGIAAKAMGMTTAELNKALEKGEVMSDVFLPKFAKALRETFTQADLERGMNSLNANLNRTSTAFFRMGKLIGEGGFNQGLSKTLQDLVKLMKDMGPVFETVGQLLYTLLIPVRLVIRLFNMVVTVLTTSWEALEKLGLSMTALKVSVTALGIALALAFAPFLATVGIITGIGIAIEDLWVFLNGGDSLIGRSGLVTYLTDLMNTLDKMWANLDVSESAKKFLMQFEWVRTVTEWYETLISKVREGYEIFEGFAGHGGFVQSLFNDSANSNDSAIKGQSSSNMAQTNLVQTDIGVIEIAVAEGSDTSQIEKTVQKGIEKAMKNRSRIQFKPLEG